MITGATGTSSCMPWEPVATAFMASTTSCPLTTLPNTAYPKSRAPWFRNLLSQVLMTNWDVAALISPVWAMAMVYLSFFRPLSASFLMGA